MHDRPRSFGRNASSLRAVRDEPVFLALDQRHLHIIAYFRRSTAVSFTALLGGSLRTRRTSFLGRQGCECIFARVLCPADKNHLVTRCRETNLQTRLIEVVIATIYADPPASPLSSTATAPTCSP